MPSRVETETSVASEDARPHKRVKWINQQGVETEENADGVLKGDAQDSLDKSGKDSSSVSDEKTTKVRLPKARTCIYSSKLGVCSDNMLLVGTWLISHLVNAEHFDSVAGWPRPHTTPATRPSTYWKTRRKTLTTTSLRCVGSYYCHEVLASSTSHSFGSRFTRRYFD
jgi:hypothetical protein